MTHFLHGRVCLTELGRPHWLCGTAVKRLDFAQAGFWPESLAGPASEPWKSDSPDELSRLRAGPLKAREGSGSPSQQFKFWNCLVWAGSTKKGPGCSCASADSGQASTSPDPTAHSPLLGRGAGLLCSAALMPLCAAFRVPSSVGSSPEHPPPFPSLLPSVPQPSAEQKPACPWLLACVCEPSPLPHAAHARRHAAAGRASR